MENDLISRAAAIQNVIWAKENNMDEVEALEHTISAVDAAPVVHGRNITVQHPVDEFICSECGFCTQDLSRYDADEEFYFEFEVKYCPNCGAKMDGGGE